MFGKNFAQVFQFSRLTSIRQRTQRQVGKCWYFLSMCFGMLSLIFSSVSVSFIRVFVLNLTCSARKLLSKLHPNICWERIFFSRFFVVSWILMEEFQ